MLWINQTWYFQAVVEFNVAGPDLQICLDSRVIRVLSMRLENFFTGQTFLRRITFLAVKWFSSQDASLYCGILKAIDKYIPGHLEKPVVLWCRTHSLQNCEEFYLNSSHCSSVRQTCPLLPPSLLSCRAHARIVMALLYTGLLGWDVGICGLISCYWDHLCARKKIYSQLFVAQCKGFSLAPMVKGIITSVSAHLFKWRKKRRVKDNSTLWAFYLEVLYFKMRILKKCTKKLGL